MVALNPKHVEWQKQALRILAIGGIWALDKNPCVVEKVSENKAVIYCLEDDVIAAVHAHIVAAGYHCSVVRANPLMFKKRFAGLGLKASWFRS